MCDELKVDSQSSLKGRIASLRTNLNNDQELFGKVYNFTFGYYREAGFTNCSKDIAVALWPIFFKDKCQFLDSWIDFIEKRAEKENKEVSIIKKDEWEMFYELIVKTKGNIKNFVDDGCWPSLIDEFMESLS